MKEITFSSKFGTGSPSSVYGHSSPVLKFVNLYNRFFTGLMPGVGDILFSILIFDIGDILLSINETYSRPEVS